ncbi:MAG TPA: PIN domain-containing protein [Candidatus Obscuribacterales bacterium]
MIFIDTGAFCAFSDRSDDCHVLAVRQFALLLTKKTRLITTNFVIDETYTWIRYRLGSTQALEFLRRTDEAEGKQPSLEITSVDRSLEQQARRMLVKFADQDLSYTDATSLALIQQRKISQAFSFDRHFRLLPIELLPGMAR